MNFFKRTPYLLRRQSISSPPLQRNFATIGPASAGYNTWSGLVAGGVVGLITVLFFVDDLTGAPDPKTTPQFPTHSYIKSNHAIMASD